MKRLYYAIRWGFVFSKALAKANWDVVKLVLAPTMVIRPGFVEVPMEASSDFEITSLANAITLTPGTITIEASEGEFFVHALTRSAAEGCVDSEMDRRVAALERPE